MKYFTRLEFKWGIIFIIMQLLWMMMEKALGWHDEKIEKHAMLTMLVAIPSIFIYVFALSEKKQKHYGGNMTWLQGFMCGAFITLVVAVLSPLSQYVVHTYITPDYFANVIDYTAKTGDQPRAKLEEHFTLKNYMMVSAAGAIVMGLVTSAIVAFFTKSKTAVGV